MPFFKAASRVSWFRLYHSSRYYGSLWRQLLHWRHQNRLKHDVKCADLYGR